MKMGAKWTLSQSLVPIQTSSVHKRHETQYDAVLTNADA